LNAIRKKVNLTPTGCITLLFMKPREKRMFMTKYLTYLLDYKHSPEEPLDNLNILIVRHDNKCQMTRMAMKLVTQTLLLH